MLNKRSYFITAIAIALILFGVNFAVAGWRAAVLAVAVYGAMTVATYYWSGWHRRRLSVLRRADRTQRFPSELPFVLLAELASLYSELADDDLARVSRRLDRVADKETVLGTIHDDEARRLYALSDTLRGRYVKTRSRSEYDCTTDADVVRVRVEAERWVDLSGIVQALFWIQAKDDVGDVAWAADAAGKTLGVRTGWKLVAFEHVNPMAKLMQLPGLE